MGVNEADAIRETLKQKYGVNVDNVTIRDEHDFMGRHIGRIVEIRYEGAICTITPRNSAIDPPGFVKGYDMSGKAFCDYVSRLQEIKRVFNTPLSYVSSQKFIDDCVSGGR